MEVGVGPPGVPDAQVGHPAGVQRAGRPELVAVPLQDADRAPQVIQGCCVPAQAQQNEPAPVQDPSGQRPAGELGRAVQGGQPGRGPGRMHECDAQGGQHVCLPLRGARPAGQAERGPQLGDALPEVAEIAQDDPGGLVRDRRSGRRRPPGQDPAGQGQGLARPGIGQRQEAVGIERIGPGHASTFGHGAIVDPRIGAIGKR
jgi:hypothetical protein